MEHGVNGHNGLLAQRHVVLEYRQEAVFAQVIVLEMGLKRLIVQLFPVQVLFKGALFAKIINLCYP